MVVSPQPLPHKGKNVAERQLKAGVSLGKPSKGQKEMGAGQPEKRGTGCCIMDFKDSFMNIYGVYDIFMRVR